MCEIEIQTTRVAYMIKNISNIRILNESLHIHDKEVEPFVFGGSAPTTVLSVSF